MATHTFLNIAGFARAIDAVVVTDVLLSLTSIESAFDKRILARFAEIMVASSKMAMILLFLVTHEFTVSMALTGTDNETQLVIFLKDDSVIPSKYLTLKDVVPVIEVSLECDNNVSKLLNDAINDSILTGLS